MRCTMAGDVPNLMRSGGGAIDAKPPGGSCVTGVGVAVCVGCGGASALSPPAGCAVGAGGGAGGGAGSAGGGAGSAGLGFSLSLIHPAFMPGMP